ncbi:hypothetical protein, partial [Phormidesmis priestleyi]|uniref:hypothetical protein n=1 Tax=Phormidesmis priestleyi TaxID=268141 RepID=UPI001E2BE621
MDREQVTWGNLIFHLSSLIYGFGLLGFYIWLFTIKWYYPLQIFLYTTTGDIIFFAAEAFIVKKLLTIVRTVFAVRRGQKSYPSARVQIRNKAHRMDS